jgi:hypothetical protein
VAELTRDEPKRAHRRETGAGQWRASTKCGYATRAWRDIGEGLTNQFERSHAIIGADLGGESATLPRRIDEDSKAQAMLALGARPHAISGRGTGPHRECSFTRLEDVELSFPVIEESFAVQPGCTIRIVEPSQISDDRGRPLCARGRTTHRAVATPGKSKITLNLARGSTVHKACASCFSET